LRERDGWFQFQKSGHPVIQTLFCLSPLTFISEDRVVEVAQTAIEIEARRALRQVLSVGAPQPFVGFALDHRKDSRGVRTRAIVAATLSTQLRHQSLQKIAFRPGH
jgi:hypothetical protein